MKSIILVLLCVYPTLLFSQNNTTSADSILRIELAEIIITSKKQKEKLQFRTFDLRGKKLFKSHSLRLPLSYQENTSTGIFIPAPAGKNLVVDHISFPIHFSDKRNKEPPLQYYLGLKYTNGKDTLIQIFPEKLTIDDNEAHLSINQNISLLQPIQGFYFFIKYNSFDSSAHSNINIFYNDKYKSVLSRRLNQTNQIEVYDLSKWVKAHAPNSDDTKNLRSLNWRVKITYATM